MYITCASKQYIRTYLGPTLWTLHMWFRTNNYCPVLSFLFKYEMNFIHYKILYKIKKFTQVAHGG